MKTIITTLLLVGAFNSFSQKCFGNENDAVDIYLQINKGNFDMNDPIKFEGKSEVDFGSDSGAEICLIKELKREMTYRAESPDDFSEIEVTFQFTFTDDPDDIYEKVLKFTIIGIDGGIMWINYDYIYNEKITYQLEEIECYNE